MRSLPIAAALVALTAFPALLPAASAVPTPPKLDARAWQLIDYQSGLVLAEQNADARVEPASLTKVMTAYLAFKAISEGRLRLDEEITISERAWKSEGSRSFVQVGTKIPAEVLLKGMIVQSGNDATIAIAERLGGTEAAFAEMMNAEAKRLGMANTNYENSTGLPGPNHYTTARDLTTLARAVIQNYPDEYKWYSIREFVWDNIKQQNRNGLLARDPSVDGIKTGHTESAGYCLLTSAKRGDQRLVAVVLGTNSFRAREDANAALLNYGYTFYETRKVKGAGETVLAPRVYKGEVENVAIGPRKDVWATLPRGNAVELTSTATVKEPLIAPLDPKVPVGELTVSAGGETVQTVPLFPLAAVPEGGWWSQLVDSVALWWQ